MKRRNDGPAGRKAGERAAAGSERHEQEPSEGIMAMTPQQSSSASSSGMPGGAMDGSSTGAQMPSGAMEPSGGSHANDMPAGAMEAGDLGSPRFASGDHPPSGQDSGGGRWEPGVVEVEFRDDVAAEVTRPTTAAAAEIRSPAGRDLSTLNQLLQRHGVMTMEPTFLRSREEAASAVIEARQAGHDVPNLANFVTMHFGADADVRRVAAELEQLPEVRRAVPVPIAIPPDIAPATTKVTRDLAAEASRVEARARQLVASAAAPAEEEAPPGTPLNEPLVGNSAQVVTSPVTGLDNQWYIFRCNVPPAWNVVSGANVVIADVDWGFRTTHEELAPRLNLARAFNAFDGGTNVSHGTSISHGTAVMGLTGAADNDLGIAGIAFGAQLWPIQANSGPGPALGGNSWARGIDWVRTADSGGRRKVIILEVQTGAFGNYEQVPSVNAAIQTAIAAGVVVCVAAGNGNRDAGIDDSGNPIPDTGSILVGATEYDAVQNRRASFSNFNARVTVCAPGDPTHDLTINSTGDSDYRNGFGGTSGATPKVAGAAALMLERNPALTHAQVRTLLRNTGTAAVTDPGKPVGTFLDVGAAVQAARAATWGPFASLGGICLYGSALASWGVNRLDAFVAGTDGALYQKFWNGDTWSGFVNLGGILVAAPAAVSRAANRIDVVVVGTDSQLFHRAWNGAAWLPYVPLGGIVLHGPAIAAAGPNRLDAFVIGTDNALYQKTWNGAAWGPYVNLGGICIASPAAVSAAPNQLDVFVVGTNNAVFHRHFDGAAWSPFVSLGGVAKYGVAASASAPNNLSVYTIGTDNALYQKTWNGAAWSAWQSLGGICTAAPAAVASPSRVDVTVIGTNSQLFVKTFS